MSWHMISDAEVRHLPVSARFFAYAEAYRNVAAALCLQMTSEEASRNWPNAAVVLLLAAHAVELFIKGAVLSRDPCALLEGHLLEQLSDEYRKRFPEPSFEWDIPFKVEYPGIAEADIEALRKATPVPSILYRYPVSRGGKEWNGAFGFEAGTFLAVLERLEHDFKRIKSQFA